MADMTMIWNAILTMAIGGFLWWIRSTSAAISKVKEEAAEAREKMIELVKVYGMSESDFLKYINSAVFKSKHEKLSDILEIIAKYDYRVLVGANSPNFKPTIFSVTKTGMNLLPL